MKTIYKPTTDNVYDKYKKLISKIAKKWSAAYDIPFDELFSEGVFSVLSKIDRWDPDKGSLCTHVHNCSNFAIWDYCQNQHKRLIPFQGDHPIFIEQEAQEKKNWLSSFLDELSEETKQLVKIIFESPDELADIIKPNCPRISKKAIKKYMTKIDNWTDQQINDSFKEIRQCL